MMNLTRRDFLKVCGASAALIGIGARQAPPGLVPFTSAVPISPKTGVGVLIDTTKCVGCQQCQVACQKAHDLPENRKVNALCPTALSVVDMKNISTDPAKPEIKPVKRQCMNCLNPSCVSACTVGALQKRDDGPVVYDSDRCIGCRYCMYACPFGVPTFEWNKQLSLISKCDNCANRIDQGKVPACVEACPAGALTYGKRTELLTMANQRIYDGKGKYIQHIYGEHEIGGTSMMYLAATPFEQLGFPALPENPPAEVNAAVMHATPTIAAGMILALSGMYWLIKRRDRLEPLFATAHDENGNGGH